MPRTLLAILWLALCAGASGETPDPRFAAGELRDEAAAEARRAAEPADSGRLAEAGALLDRLSERPHGALDPARLARARAACAGALAETHDLLRISH